MPSTIAKTVTGPKFTMIKPTQKRVYFTRHAQGEHKYVVVLNSVGFRF